MLSSFFLFELYDDDDDGDDDDDDDDESSFGMWGRGGWRASRRMSE